MRAGSTATLSTPAGWSAGGADENGPNATQGPLTAIRYKVLDGTEGYPSTGAQQTFTSSASQTSSHRSWLFEAGTFDPANPLEALTAEATSTTHDPPSLSPTGGAQDYFFGVVLGNTDNTTANTFPTGYGNTIDIETSSHNLAAGDRTANTATENPSAFSIANSLAGLAITFAVRPAPDGGGPTYVNAAASWTGAAAFAASAKLTSSAAVAWAGAATLAADGVLVRGAAAAFHGAATFAADTVLLRDAAASLTAASAFAASAKLTSLGALTLTGTGTFGAAATAGAFVDAAASFVGAAALAAAGKLTSSCALALSGTGSFTAAARLTSLGAAGFAGVGVFQASSVTGSYVDGSAAFGGAGVFSPAAKLTSVGALVLSGSATFSIAAPRATMRAVVAWAGVGAFAAAALTSGASDAVPLSGPTYTRAVGTAPRTASIGHSPSTATTGQAPRTREG